MYLAAKYKAILTHIRGDWEFHASAFSLPKWNNVARMCCLCRATGTEGHELSYGRCDREAPWRSTRVTHESWRSELLDNGQELPSLFRYTRGLRIESIVIDSLHTAELGITAHVLGNIFQLWINARVFGATVDANVKNLASDLDSARRRQIVSTETSRKTAFAPRTAGQNSTSKVPLRDAWSRTLWDWRCSILDPGSNWSVSCWCGTTICWLRRDSSSRPLPKSRCRRWVFASAKNTRSSRRIFFALW